MALLWLSGCGGTADIATTKLCDGDPNGLQVKGVVRMPNGRIARSDSAWQRFASAVWPSAVAVTADVSPIPTGELIELVELRQEDIDSGTDPGPVRTGTTGPNGEFCMGLPVNTDENLCRYVLQVGDRAHKTLTRAFVFSTAEPVDIDYLGEATVRVILTQIPPATLCDFSADEIRTIHDAVVAAPGDASGPNADEVNSLAASIAAADPGVDAALSAAFNRPPTPTATPTHAPPTATATGPTPTRTEVMRRTETFTPRPTRTQPPATFTETVPIATSTATRQANTPTSPRAPTRTATPS